MGYHDQFIERGMALLDEKVPGWEHRVDLKTLDLNDCTECVVGQLFQTYINRLTTLGREADHFPHRFGFSLDWDNWRTTWGGLTTAWKRAIRTRRAEVAQPTSSGDPQGSE